MKRLLPDGVELMIFAILAIVCTGIVAWMPARDLGMSALSVPIFIASAMMGMRRSGQLGGARKTLDANEATES